MCSHAQRTTLLARSKNVSSRLNFLRKNIYSQHLQYTEEKVQKVQKVQRKRYKRYRGNGTKITKGTNVRCAGTWSRMSYALIPTW